MQDKTWEQRFQEQFGDNVVWWQECIAEMRIGDPDFNRLKDFIRKEKELSRQEGIELARQAIIEKYGVMDGIEDLLINLKANK